MLSSLKKQDSYIYELTKNINHFSGGLLQLTLSTIYTATYKLESEGYLSEYTRKVGKKRTRVYYHLEPVGEEYLKELSSDYTTTTAGIQQFLSALEATNAVLTEENLPDDE